MYFPPKKKYDPDSLRFNIKLAKWNIHFWNRRWFLGITWFRIPKHIVSLRWQIRLYDIKNQRVVYQKPSVLQALNLNNHTFKSNRTKNKIIQKFQMLQIRH